MYRKPARMILFALLLVPLSVFAGENGQADGFSRNTRALLFGNVLHPANSSQNPNNAFAQVNRYSAEVDLRPDFFWEQSCMDAIFKPRVTAAYTWWKDGMPDGRKDSLSRAFVNEWRLQAKPLSMLFLSFGKEKLLWGPSFLSNPSNILFKDTEKINPKIEVEGKYLAKLILVPASTFTVSVVSETQKEDSDLGRTLKPLRFLKTDLLGGNYAISIIGYHRQNDRLRLGSYGQWTTSDALVLYYDGLVTRGTDALYPVEDGSNPLGGTFARKNENSRRFFGTVAAGGSYTFLAGSTVSLEFLYNEQGYNSAEAGDYYQLRRKAAENFIGGAALFGLSQKTLAEAVNNELPFLRKYYVMGQFQFREIANVLDLILRYLYNIEEHAGQASTILEWQLTDHVQFFNINSIAVSHANETEFKSLVDKSFMAGIEVHL